MGEYRTLSRIKPLLEATSLFLKAHKWKSWTNYKCSDDDVQVVFGKLDQAASMFEVEESLQRLQCSILLIDGFGVVIMKLI